VPTIVETPGADNANSFVSLSEFDAWLDTRLNTSTILARSTADRQRALIEATRDITRLDFVGIRASTTQSL
jgi:hypothetical protein